jgi:hypothetical protein
MLIDMFGLLMIGITIAVWVVALRLNRTDPNYFRTRHGTLHWWDFSAYAQVLGMVFDRRLPDPKHGTKMRRDIYTARGLYALGVGLGAFFFYFIFTRPHLFSSH